MRTTTRKKLLLASAAVVVMGLGMASKPAMAFDEVNWQWDKLVTEDVIKNVLVDITVAPTGMVEIEKKQDFIGDVTAVSTISDIENNPPSEIIDGIVLVEDFFNINTVVDDATDPSTISPAPAIFGSELQLQAELLDGTLDEGTDVLDMNFRVFGEFEVDQVASELDAIDLPKMESIATAVGNNQDIFSTVSVELHDGQFLWGGYREEQEPGTAQSDLSTLLSFTPDLGNTHTSGAAYLAFAGQLGMIDPANISATSTVTNILNASVDSDATAIANNMSVEIAAFTPDDAFMLADITQHAYADVSATSMVDAIMVNNYTNFGGAGMGPGDLQIPLIRSNASAIGNNFSVNVSSPEL